jgi:biotin-(acetyl-CoA carboxylase) ligase
MKEAMNPAWYVGRFTKNKKTAFKVVRVRILAGLQRLMSLGATAIAEVHDGRKWLKVKWPNDIAAGKFKSRDGARRNKWLLEGKRASN